MRRKIQCRRKNKETGEYIKIILVGEQGHAVDRQAEKKGQQTYRRNFKASAPVCVEEHHFSLHIQNSKFSLLNRNSGAMTG